MTDNIVPINSSQSPFDAIRHFDENEKEYWSGRELMVLVAYPRWADFKDVIARAEFACRNTGNQVTEHFSGTVLKNPNSKTGRNQSDIFLSRYGAYLVAMNGDPRKPEVAAAQSYFAIKTFEAEIVIPKQNDQLRELELRVQLAEAERDAAIAQKVLLDKREAVLSFHASTPAALILGATVITDKTPIEKVIDYSSGRTFEGVGITAIAQKLGYGKNTKACWQWLDSIGYGKTSKHWEEQLAAVINQKLNPDAYEDILTKWNNGVRQRFIGE